jgi:hypothetical protein
MCHKGLYLDMSYFKAEEPLHLGEYRKAIPHSTIYVLPMEEKKLRAQMLLGFAELQSYSDNQLKKLEEVLARAKDMESAITEFRRLKGETETASAKHIIAKGELELLRRLDDGWSLIQSLNEDRFLLQKA